MRDSERGFAFSIREGIEKSSGKFIVVMDTDFTHDPILIEKMTSLRNDYEIISGSRYIDGGSMENQLHWITNCTAETLFVVLFDVKESYLIIFIYIWKIAI